MCDGGSDAVVMSSKEIEYRLRSSRCVRFPFRDPLDPLPRCPESPREPAGHPQRWRLVQAASECLMLPARSWTNDFDATSGLRVCH